MLLHFTRVRALDDERDGQTLTDRPLPGPRKQLPIDPLTEKMVVAVGGMGRDGTLAAGEFITEPRYLEMLASQAPKNWEKKNLQVVLATDVVRGNTGPPRILATHFW